MAKLVHAKADAAPTHSRGQVTSEVAAVLIDAMSKCDTPWQKPWSARAMCAVNGATGHAYRGINRILLGLSAREDPRWMTYQQAQAKGWQVKKGEKGIGIVKVIDLGGPSDEPDRQEGGGGDARTGVEQDASVVSRPKAWTLRRYTVFNAEQIKGPPELEAPLLNFEPVARAEAVIEALKEKTGLVVRHGGSQAYYAPSMDEVHLPVKSSFDTAYEYHAVALHEGAHSTLAAHRLNRREAIAQRWGDEAYAVEELRAEICSAILAAETGVPISQAHIVNHAAYLNSWIKAIKRDPMALFSAAKDAEKMADYMLGLEKQSTAVAEHAEWVADYDRHR